MPRYGRETLLRRDGATYGSPRSRVRYQGRGMVYAELGRRSVWWRGDGILQTIRATGSKYMWDHHRRMWTTPIGTFIAIRNRLDTVERRLLQHTEVDR